MTVSGQRSFHPVTSFNLGRSATSGVVAHGLRASRRARPRVSCAAMLQLTALLLVAQIQLPPPRGYVNDFARVLDSASVAHMEAVIPEVRAKTRYLAREESGAGLAYGVDLIAQAFAQEFGVTLDAAPPGARPVERDVSFPSRAMLFWLIFAVVFTLAQLARRRGRRGRRIWWVGGGWGGGGWGGGWGGGGGGGGGGFGGVGGGGGVFGRGAGGGLLYWPRNHRRANLAGGGA